MSFVRCKETTTALLLCLGTAGGRIGSGTGRSFRTCRRRRWFEIKRRQAETDAEQHGESQSQCMSTATSRLISSTTNSSRGGSGRGHGGGSVRLSRPKLAYLSTVSMAHAWYFVCRPDARVDCRLRVVRGRVGRVDPMVQPTSSHDCSSTWSRSDGSSTQRVGRHENDAHGVGPRLTGTIKIQGNRRSSNEVAERQPLLGRIMLYTTLG